MNILYSLFDIFKLVIQSDLFFYPCIILFVAIIFSFVRSWLSF